MHSYTHSHTPLGQSVILIFVVWSFLQQKTIEGESAVLLHEVGTTLSPAYLVPLCHFHIAISTFYAFARS